VAVLLWPEFARENYKFSSNVAVGRGRHVPIRYDKHNKRERATMRALPKHCSSCAYRPMLYSVRPQKQGTFHNSVAQMNELFSNSVCSRLNYWMTKSYDLRFLTLVLRACSTISLFPCTQLLSWTLHISLWIQYYNMISYYVDLKINRSIIFCTKRTARLHTRLRTSWAAVRIKRYFRILQTFWWIVSSPNC